MKALLSRSPGGELSLEDLPSPVAGGSELLIEVHACGLNYPDVLLIEDRYQVRPPRPFAPGGELAGRVTGLGPDAEGFRIGDRVIALPGFGGLVEQIALPAANCVKMPETMGFEDAAALLGTYGTSYHALKQRAALRPGERMLVLGAAGGVGIAAVQLGRAIGSEVIAAVSSEAKADFTLKHGASKAFTYPHDLGGLDVKSLNATFKSEIGPEGTNVIYDAIGGPYTEAALRTAAWGGRLLIVGFPAGIAAIPANLPLLKGCSVVGVFYGRFLQEDPTESRKNIDEIFDLYELGKIRPIISEVYSLADGGTGIAHLADRTAQGKIIVTLPALEK